MSTRAASRSASPADVPSGTTKREADVEQKEPPAEDEAEDSGSEFEESSENGDADDAVQKPDATASSSTSKLLDGANESEKSDAGTSETTTATSGTPATSTAWQAIWSPAHNAYYFFNSQTQETTWTNPLEPSAPSSSSDASTSANDTPEPSAEPSSSSSATTTQQANVPAHLRSMYEAQAAAEAAGIDPSLAFLDPTLAVPGGAPIGGYATTARFNARTGAFAKTDARDPTHLSEFARMQRMSQFYFDTQQWERDVEKRKAEEEADEEAGRRKKKPTKADLDRFKEQKRQKKLAKTAWLRN